MVRSEPGPRLWPRARAARGFTLIEILLVAAILITLVAMGIPFFDQWLDHYRTHAAARYLAGRFGIARMEAVKRSARVGLRFEDDGPTSGYATYVDGNANGIRSRDIALGVDPMISPSERLGDLFPGVTFGIHPSVPEIGTQVPASDGRDPVRFGSSRIVTFTPIGTATSGTVYLRGRGSAQYAVRVLGVTGRTRVMQFDAGLGEWVTK